jgi:hypothetical protein
MWFLAIAAGIVIVIVAALLAERARRAGHPALGSFAESTHLPVLGASIFIAVGLAQRDTAWTLAWLLLVYAAGIMITSVARSLAERARRAGHPTLGSFTGSASFLVSVASLWVAWGLALHHVDWTALAGFPLGYAVCAVWRTLRHRRKNAHPPVERP